MRPVLLAAILVILFSSCDNSKEKSRGSSQDHVFNAMPSDSNRVNILWIVAEDLSPVIPSFGDSTIVTPALSQLAAEGVCFDNFFTPHPVCSPARASIITGMYANSIGASHMRTGPWFSGPANETVLANYQKAMPKDIRPYEAVPPSEVKMFTEYLRAAGYYCTNNSKEDYQFAKTITAWDESSNKAHWRNRPPGKPFFSVFNINVTHESRIWAKAGDSLWVDRDLEVPFPPYLPDSEIAIKDIRRMYSNIKEMDMRVQKILDELEADGLTEKTVIFWYTDHGGPLPRQKRMLYDSGTKVPLIIRFPNAINRNTRDSRMTSFVDLAPTLLSLANIPIPEYMQGSAFLGQQCRKDETKYVYGAADRFDETTDHARSVRDKRFKYIRYYDTIKPMFLEVAYRNQMPIMKELLRLKDLGQLSPEQSLWFRESKPREELFDLEQDPFEINNLAKDQQYKEKLTELRQACDQWVNDINDLGLLNEKELIQKFWPNGKQPVTAEPQFSVTQDSVSISCKTKGASIGYQIFSTHAIPEEMNWKIYSGPVFLDKNQRLTAKAHRLGYRESSVVGYINQK